MKTLADFKRALTIGSKWSCVHELHHCDYGTREIVFKDSVKVGFKVIDGFLKGMKVSYLYFPKADLIEFHEQEVHIFCPKNEMFEKPRTHILTYKMVKNEIL